MYERRGFSRMMEEDDGDDINGEEVVISYGKR